MPAGDRQTPESSPIEPAVPRSASRRRGGLRQIALPYTVDPSDERLHLLTWLERVRHDVRSGGVGVVVSLLLHAIAMVILGLIFFQTQQTGDGEPLSATWSNPSSPSEKTAKPRRAVSIPIEVASGGGTQPSQPKTAAPAGDESPVAHVTVAPVAVSEALQGRNPRLRSSLSKDDAGSSDTEKAIKAALGWLARQQLSDGHWELHQGYPDAGRPYIRTDTGATALALLSFLGHGETHQSGDHQQVVAKGLKWLLAVQDPVTGDLHDQRQEEGRNAAFYAHSMGTIALCEALAMTHDVQFRPAAEQAVQYLIESQHPDMGGWKYRPLTQRVMSGDISVTAWALMALHSARIAGLDVPAEAFERSSSFLDRVQEQNGARYKYEPNEPPARVTAARTAMGLLCRQWLGWPKSHPPMVSGVEYLSEERHRPQWLAGRRNVFEWYYITQVLHNVGGDGWIDWYKTVRPILLQNQVTSGGTKAGQDIRGSWSPRPEGEGEEYSDKAGRLYLTAMCVLILETPYRHRPVYAE